MLAMKSTILGAVLLGLAACSSGLASRGNLDTGPAVARPVVENGMTLVPAEYNVTKINVTVPRDLRVSEANVFYPIADIVWHGDPLGDRYEQVAAILREGLAAGTKDMVTGQAVELDVQVTRFHALTMKTRYTTGGTHDTEFMLTLRDAATGDVLDGPRKVLAAVRASGGQRAMEEEAAGITQKTVIEARIAEVIKEQLSSRLVPATAPDATAEAAVTRDAFTPAELPSVAPLVDWNGALRPVT